MVLCSHKRLRQRLRLRRYVRLGIAAVGTASVTLLAVEGLPSAGAKGGAGGGGSVQAAALSAADVPAVPGLERFVRDQTATVRLGKALFWDMQAGSDGRTACASCHFSAGADNRSRNQINPRGGSFALKGPNAQLTADDFPIHSDNVVGSQGVLPSAFKGITDGDPFDNQAFAGTDADFHIGSVNVRRSTGRNTPSAINAVFNFRQFWDGRAQNDFNGVNPFGNRDADARVGHVGAAGGIEKVAVSLTNSSLASQATGPPGNGVEMSAEGRTLSDIGRKLLSVRPLGAQQVSRSDSMLGDVVHGSGRGLSASYGDMIKQAFQSDWWNSSDAVTAANGRSYSLMQFNFPLFWGLAIQAYESTLVSDQTPFDRFERGDASALSAQAQDGMGIFNGKGSCNTCHTGVAFSSATVAEVAAQGAVSNDGHDTGFFNIGVRPTASDPGQAGTDPFGAPLSIAGLTGQSTSGVPGSFKTPDLRNVELTAPYFHNGGQLTLRQVVDFYSRGGDFANAERSGEIQNLGLTDAEKDSVVAFLQSLTDPRVRDQSAPFDHPQLFVPAGEQTNADGSVVADGNGRAVDCFKDVPATGASGGAALARFPSFTGPPCDTAPALERPGSSSGPGGGSSGGPGSAQIVTTIGTRRPAPAVLSLRILPRVTLREVRRRGIRLTATVPQSTRRIRLRLYRVRGARKVRIEQAVKRVTRGGRITIQYRTRATRRLAHGTYLLQVDAGPRSGAYLAGGAQARLRI